MTQATNNFKIPDNERGKPLDLEASVKKTRKGEAERLYRLISDRLMHPHKWNNLTGNKGAQFSLHKAAFAQNGNSVEPNDFIKIDIPGPGLKNGDGYDWVMVEKIGINFDPEADESFGILLKVCPDPEHVRQKEVSHFFQDGATSTLTVTRIGNRISARYYGRNEVPNLHVSHLGDKIRNAVTSFAALAGLSKIQWNIFLQGLIKE